MSSLNEELTVLTFVDRPLDSENYLMKSCEGQGLHLETVVLNEWPYNTIKIRLLHDYLATAPPNRLVLFVDALDVYMCGTKEEILEKYQSFGADIVFSAEANFSFHNLKLGSTYFRKYPKGPTIYDFLNSGSFMGSVCSLQQMIGTILQDYELDLNTIGRNPSLKSDQTIYHRYYVDQYIKENTGLKIALDHTQKLFGCTGGRFCIRSFRDYSKSQVLAFFNIERQLLKVTNLHFLQYKSKDYSVKGERFYNHLTDQFPTVMHMPGTWKNFQEIIQSYLEGTPYAKGSAAQKLAAAILSNAAYLLSFPLSLFLRRKKAEVIKD